MRRIFVDSIKPSSIDCFNRLAID